MIQTQIDLLQPIVIIYCNNMVEVTNSFKLSIAIGMILAGALDTILYKLQNKQFVTEGYNTKYFFHPFMQVQAMFLGQMLAGVLYLILRFKYPEEHQKKQEIAVEEGKELKFNKLKIAIPAICDCGASTLQLFALNFTAGSIYQMMRGGTIITTFIFSIIMLKMKPKRYQMVGSLMAFLGIGLVGTAAMVFADPQVIDAGPQLQLIGYLMLIGSLFLNGVQFTYQQTLFDRYHIDPLMLVGIQGCFAFSLLGIITTILNFIPCSFGQSACAYSENGYPYIQQTIGYFKSISSTAILIISGILGVFSITTFNVCGVSVTKYINAIARSICDVTRTVLIWLVGIIVTVTLGDTKENYVWQSLQGVQIVMQSIGFVILILGNLLYNRIVKFNCLENTDDEQRPLVKDSPRNDAQRSADLGS